MHPRDLGVFSQRFSTALKDLHWRSDGGSGEIKLLNFMSCDLHNLILIFFTLFSVENFILDENKA